MMEEGWKDSGKGDITAVASEEPAIDVDQSPPSPEQEPRLQFHEQRSESPATEAVQLDSQSEGSRRESDSHSHACVTVSPPASPGRVCHIHISPLVGSQTRRGRPSLRENSTRMEVSMQTRNAIRSFIISVKRASKE